MRLNIGDNRAAKKWSKKELVGRIAWSFAAPFFRFSPRVLWSWRRMLLRIFGAKIGAHVHIYPNTKIIIPWHLEIEEYTAVGANVTLYALGHIHIGARVTISQNVHLCAGTHDWRDPAMPLIKSPLKIGNDAWICADAFVGPGVRIGEGAIVGARATAMKDVEPAQIVGGNPAIPIGRRYS